MRSLTSKVALILIGFVVLVGFQNCSSEAPFGDTTLLDSLVTSSDFPYTATFDQIAYMSCSEQQDVFPDPQAFFTFRAGAYRTAGLRLSDTFVQTTERMTDSTRRDILRRNLLSAGSRLRFSLRPNENFQSIYRNGDSAPVGNEGLDYASVFTNMGDETILDQLINLQPRESMRTWNNAPFESQIRLEGSLQFSGSEILQNDLRNQITRGLLMTLTFTSEEENSPRGPGTLSEDQNSLRRDVFGTAVQMRFKQAFPGDFEDVPGSRFQNAAPSTDTPPRLLASIEEVPLSASGIQPLNSWSCPAELALRIVLPQHAVAQGCQILPDPSVPSQELAALRQSLFVEDWYIDLTNRCAVPREDRNRTGACYGIDSNTQDTRIIQYDFSQPCGLDGQDGACAHFVSVCVRNN